MTDKTAAPETVDFDGALKWARVWLSGSNALLKVRPDTANGARVILAQRELIGELVELLAIFLGQDDRFQISVGGNPVAVKKMFADAQSILARTRLVLP